MGYDLSDYIERIHAENNINSMETEYSRVTNELPSQYKVVLLICSL